MTDALAFGIVLPAVVGGVFWGFGGRVWRRGKGHPPMGEGWGAPAVALSCVAGALALLGWPGFPPKVAEGWLPFLAVAGLGAGPAVSRFPPLRPLRFALQALAVGLVLGRPRALWSTGEAIAWHGAAFAGAAGVHAAIDAVAARRPGPATAFALWLWCSALAGSLAMTGSLKYGQLAGLPAATLGAAVVVAALQPSLSLGYGATAVLAPWNAALLLCGYFYSELPAGASLLLAAAPISMCVADTLLGAGRPRVAAAARIAALGLPAGIALAIAAWPMLFPGPEPGGADSPPSPW